MQFRCPHCQAPAYSRKNKICGVCEKPLPAELLLSEKQAAFLRRQDEQMEKRAKEFQLPNPDYSSDIGGMV